MAEENALEEADYFLDQDYLCSYLKDNFNMTIAKHHPTAKKRLSWVFIQNQKRKIPKKDFDEKPTDQFKQELAEKFKDFKEPISTLILNSSTFFPTQVYNVRKLPKFSFGRVALIGDALQTTDPFSGMGATLSLEDGLYLAKMLRDHVDHEDAFYYYEFDRKDFVRKIHQLAEEMENIDLEEIDSYLEDGDNGKMENMFLDMPKVNWDTTE